MHWILQDTFQNEPEQQEMIEILEKLDIPYSVHKVVPFVGELIPTPDLTTNNVVCFGSYSMRRVAKEYGWTPGVFDLFEHNFLKQKEHWRKLMLNYDSKVYPFKDVPEFYSPYFIRPIEDTKYFAGKLFNPDEFQEWQHNVCELKLDYGNSLKPETLVQVSKPKEIYSEYRFWIVNGKIVTASLYKRGSRIIYDSEVGEKFHDFVRMAINIWQPDKAFVIDVCDTPEGLRIVEINTINASGYYAADIYKLVEAFERNFNE
jgi:hypothetical protein